MKTQFDLALRSDGPVQWRHAVLGEQDRAFDWSTYDLQPSAIAALTDEETRPRRAAFADGDVVILRTINPGVFADPNDMLSLRIWISSEQILTLGFRDARAILDTQRRVVEGRFQGEPPDLFLLVAEMATERFKDVVRKTESALDDLEDNVLGGSPLSVSDELKALRRQAITLRRFASPQLEALEDLLQDPPKWLDERRSLKLREIVNATERTVEALSSTREHISAVQDQIELQLADQTRRANKALATVATVFLPLNLFAALLGANVGGVPLADSPAGFSYLLAGTLVTLAAALTAVFRFWWFR